MLCERRERTNVGLCVSVVCYLSPLLVLFGRRQLCHGDTRQLTSRVLQREHCRSQMAKNSVTIVTSWSSQNATNKNWINEKLKGTLSSENAWYHSFQDPLSYTVFLGYLQYVSPAREGQTTFYIRRNLEVFNCLTLWKVLFVFQTGAFWSMRFMIYFCISVANWEFDPREPRSRFVDFSDITHTLLIKRPPPFFKYLCYNRWH